MWNWATVFQTLSLNFVLRGKHGSLVLLGKCSIIFMRSTRELCHEILISQGFACLLAMSRINDTFGVKGVHDFKIIWHKSVLKTFHSSYSWHWFSLYKNTFTFITAPTTVADMGNHSVIEGRNLTHEYNVSGSSPIVSWTHINSNKKKSGKTWISMYITRQEQGEYISEASNFCGHDRKSTYVNVKCKF